MTGASSPRTIAFRGGLRTVAAFGVAVTVLIAVFVRLDPVLSGGSAWLELGGEIAKFAGFAAIVVALLRVEGVGLAALGLGRRDLRLALVAFAGVWIALNVVGVAVAVWSGNQWGVGLIRATVGPRWESLPAPWLITVALQFLVVGLIEEFTVRGYLQTKIIALLGDETRPRIALGIVVAGLVFGLLHVPGAVLDGASAGGVLGVVLSRTLTGLAFGTLYELTQNVYFVALLHGLGNTWPLLVDWGAWSGRAVVVFFVGVGVVYVGATVAYRRWTTGSERAPAVDRTDSGRPSRNPP